MANGIHTSLLSLAVDMDTLSPLGGNPRHGNVEAIMSSYTEFGQIKPIVVRPNLDGTSTIIAGNHQYQAAKRLGWDKIAAVQYHVDDKRALAFALADNRTMELGYSEPELLNEIITEINEFYPELIEGLGWDEYEVAEIEQRSIRGENEVVSGGSYTSPVMVPNNELTGNGFSPSSRVDNFADYEERDEDDERPKASIDSNSVSITRDRDGNQQINARAGVDQNDAVTRGSTTVSPGSAPQAVVQYTIVFDNHEQQRTWYDFIKWLKSDAAVVGTTTAERLIDFIQQHTEI